MEIPSGEDNRGDVAAKEEEFDAYDRSLFKEYVEAGYYVAEPLVEVVPSVADYAIEDIAESLEPYFRFFTKEDLDIIYLNFMGRKTQVDLQAFFGKSQPAICSGSYRIREAAKVVARLAAVADDFIEFLRDPELRLDYRDRNILTVFFYSTSITKTAQLVGITPMLCRARVDKAICRLKERGYDKIYGYFRYILEHLNKIKKEVAADFAGRRLANRDYPTGRVAQYLPLLQEEKAQ